ncbi:UDP-N-acetylglucosamine 4,6-dehydratase (inverting) [Hippea alviniae]|uniref:UDP-N-acetylglucosamine 4,6-dehydratase (inverting) n=1 Tax=Hippea alviniae TaxID=1279027 RepID=UPI0003B46379|nr:UDP-N-acetylglucosamine 4,6-dehydratase (inverting) [Hippea alviniae]
MFNDKTILITGGTGSFGRKFTELLLKRYKPKKIIIYSRDEFKQFEMSKVFNDKCMRYFIGDVRDKERLKRAFEDVDYVVHAAALKQVPAAEYNPMEAIKTNVLGANNVIDAALDSGVKKVIALSTDKAVNPINLYGATKLAADKLFIAANKMKGKRDIKFSVVRYGNVMASRGSVIPFFMRLTEEGAKELPITHPEMTRFWITLEEAAEFVMSSFETMRGGEIFVPKIPSMRITDLAKAINPDAKFKIIGIRPGEKLHETLVSIDESYNTIEFENYYAIQPSIDVAESEEYLTNAWNEKGERKEYGFSFRSDNNGWWLTVDDLKKKLKEIYG